MRPLMEEDQKVKKTNCIITTTTTAFSAAADHQSAETSTSSTRDFMNVDSFSQLPFIRPARHNHKPPPLRLFGIDFDDHYSTADDDTTTTTAPASNKLDITVVDNGRRFECHYCCRNFPTSQALGGHQNAHKRERQHAKRAHLHSAAADAARIYGFFDYPSSSTPPQPPTYRSWNNSNTHDLITATANTSRIFYGSQLQPTINGSPLGVWGIPPAAGGVWERPSLSSSRPPVSIIPRPEETQSGRPSPQNRFVYEPRLQLQDNVSDLDLHL